MREYDVDVEELGPAVGIDVVRVARPKILLISFTTMLLLVCYVGYEFFLFNDGRLHVIFCNVGQGDGIVVRTPQGSLLINDGGPDDSIVHCLSTHAPFWERTISLMLLTHPHADHLNGLVSVLDRYSVLYFGTEKLTNDTAGFRELTKTVLRDRIPVRYLYAGSKIKTRDKVNIQIIGPTREFITLTSPNGIVGEKKEFASLITHISYGSFDVVLTGDSQAEELKEAVGLGSLYSVEILQVPHHGSKTGLDEEVVDMIHPRLAVISVGKNKYGHPSPRALQILSDKDIRILRTDQHGDIEIISDGKTWEVK